MYSKKIYIIHRIYSANSYTYTSIFFSIVIHHSPSQCPVNNSAHSLLLVNTTDPCSHASVLLGHHAHAGKVCQCFFEHFRFSVQAVGQDQERTLKFIKERFESEGMVVAERGDEMINMWASGRHAQTTSPGPKQGHCLLSKLTWACRGHFCPHGVVDLPAKILRMRRYGSHLTCPGYWGWHWQHQAWFGLFPAGQATSCLIKDERMAAVPQLQQINLLVQVERKRNFEQTQILL